MAGLENGSVRFHRCIPPRRRCIFCRDYGDQLGLAFGSVDRAFGLLGYLVPDARLVLWISSSAIDTEEARPNLAAFVLPRAQNTPREPDLDHPSFSTLRPSLQSRRI